MITNNSKNKYHWLKDYISPSYTTYKEIDRHVISSINTFTQPLHLIRFHLAALVSQNRLSYFETSKYAVRKCNFWLIILSKLCIISRRYQIEKNVL